MIPQILPPLPMTFHHIARKAVNRYVSKDDESLLIVLFAPTLLPIALSALFADMENLPPYKVEIEQLKVTSGSTVIWPGWMEHNIYPTMKQVQFYKSMFPLHSPLMKLIVWNTRGCGNDIFFRHLDDIMKIQEPSVLLLLETKIYG